MVHVYEELEVNIYIQTHEISDISSLMAFKGAVLCGAS